MTALRPERESGAEYGESFTDGSSYGSGGGQGTPYGQQPYGAPGTLGDGWYGDTPQDPYGGTSYSEGSFGGDPYGGAAHNGAAQPGEPAGDTSYGAGAPDSSYSGAAYVAAYGGTGHDGTGYDGGGQAPNGVPYDATATAHGGTAYDGTAYDGTAYGGTAYNGAPAGAAYAGPAHAGPAHAGADYGGAASGGPAAETAYLPPVDDETVALRIPDPPEPSTREPTGTATAADSAEGGRAARRKAARRGQGRRGAAPGHDEPGGASRGSDEPHTPLSRVEARRRARESKPGAAVVASRAIGEVFITFGVLMLLFVTYQLWWTNVRAQAQAGKEVSDLQNDWANGKRNPGAFEPGQGFALLHMPKLDVVVPIAEGINSKKVLDRGMVGHYAEGALKTAMPEDKTGNFGLAGHRNTHGEPFRYINRLEPGDPIVVETQDTYFVYKMASILPVTSPSNISVLEPVPKGSGFTGPGRYITLTTCTPEFTSKYRMIVWGKMAEERPRSKGKPDALVN